MKALCTWMLPPSLMTYRRARNDHARDLRAEPAALASAKATCQGICCAAPVWRCGGSSARLTVIVLITASMPSANDCLPSCYDLSCVMVTTCLAGTLRCSKLSGVDGDFHLERQSFKPNRLNKRRHEHCLLLHRHAGDDFTMPCTHEVRLSLH